MLAQWFQRGGMTMFWITALLLPLLVVCVVHVALRARWSLWLGGFLAVLAIAFGAFGHHVSSSRGDDAVDRFTQEGRMTPDELAEMRAAGDDEARVPLVYGACVAGAAVLLLAIGELRRRRG